MITGTLKMMTLTEIAQLKNCQSALQSNLGTKKYLVLVADQPTTITTPPSYTGPGSSGQQVSRTDQYFVITELTYNQQKQLTDYFGYDTYCSWVGKHVKASFNSGSYANDVVGLLVTNLAGVRCAITE